jgi:hypothetical protein
VNRRGFLRALGAGLVLAGIQLGLSEAPRLIPRHEVWGDWVFDPPLALNRRGTIVVDHQTKRLTVYHADGEGRTLSFDAVSHPLAFAINSLSPFA